jgi:hypothetical protein
MKIMPVYLGQLFNSDKDYGLACGGDDVYFVVPSDSDYHMELIKVINIDRMRIPPYFRVYSVDFPFRVFLHEESISDIGAYNLITQQVEPFATIYPSHYFGSEISVSQDRTVLAASSLYFFLFSQSGELKNYCHQDGCSMLKFQPPLPAYFVWESPGSFPSSISASTGAFVIGGKPINAIFKYSYTGRLILSLDGFYSTSRYFRFQDEELQRVRIDNANRIWASTSERLYVFSPNGEPIKYWSNSELMLGKNPVNLFGWFGIDSHGRLWIYGQPEQTSIPFGAFELF